MEYQHRWLPEAQKLPVGSHSRLDCARCGWGTGTKAAIINHNIKKYSCFCNACGLVRSFKKGDLSLAEIRHLKQASEAAKVPLAVVLPFDYTLEIPEVGRQWLYSCGISPSLWVVLGIGWSSYYQRVVLPVYNHKRELVWFQMRAVYEGQRPKYIQPAAAKNVVYTVHKDLQPRIAIVVEDIASAVRINHLPLHVSGYAVMGTTLTDSQIKELVKHPIVYTWFDNDKAGKAACKKVRRTLGLWVDVARIVSQVDPKKLTNYEMIRKII